MQKQKLNVALDLRIVSAALLLIIIGMLVAWRPWTPTPGAKDRTISVSGEATVSATPDEYVFYPSYEFKNADKAANLAAVSAKSDELISELKKLGVNADKIKADTNSYDTREIYTDTTTTPTAVLQLTVTVSDEATVQKVQDYLVSTTPSGTISPQASFSTEKRKSLESSARTKATKDARAKADESAGTLGFKVGGVKSVSDSTQGGGVMPFAARGAVMSADAGDARASLAVNPGQNELNYTVTVVYYIR